jgi:hypothetical protein
LGILRETKAAERVEEKNDGKRNDFVGVEI